MNIVAIANHGPLIEATNFWSLPHALAGKFFVSVNAGAIRVMVPNQHRAYVKYMRTAKECVLSRGPWPEMGLAEAVEILFDDGTDAPFVVLLGPESFDLLPAEPEVGREWVLTAWVEKKGRPHRAIERVCHWRRVNAIPCMQPWQKVS